MPAPLPTAEVPPSLTAIPGLWRGDQLSQPAAPGVPTGFHTLDRQLPGGGWPVGAFTEVLGHESGIGEMRLLLPALAILTRSGSTWFLITSPALARSPVLPNAASIAAAGIDLARIILIRPASETEALWSVEQILRAGIPGMVTAWLDRATAPQLRRLQLAAEDRQVADVVFALTRSLGNPPRPRCACASSRPRVAWRRMSSSGAARPRPPRCCSTCRCRSAAREGVNFQRQLPP